MRAAGEKHEILFIYKNRHSWVHKKSQGCGKLLFFSPEIVDLKQVAAQQLATAPDSNPGPVWRPGMRFFPAKRLEGVEKRAFRLHNIKSPSHLEWKKIGTVETTGSLSFFSDLRAQIFS